MYIVHAIVLARTEYVIYFLLSAWLEALVHDGRARALPQEARKLPVRGPGDVSRRLAMVRAKLDQHAASAPADVRALKDAAAALSVACQQLRDLSAGRDTIGSEPVAYSFPAGHDEDGSSPTRQT